VACISRCVDDADYVEPLKVSEIRERDGQVSRWWDAVCGI